ncbi:hypothetical protein [Massilia sp. TWR1-2-2]|uniref:hypothetical protein n=1 Tax=Massilia sp. TWR1-2-2 TaxID=2804584 RepID=UPI003CF934B1
MNISVSNPNELKLTAWQRKQAAMLYHFASLDYLKGLHRMVSDLMNGFIDPLLSAAKQQGRDSVLVDPRWGTRNTVANWSNNAWPFLKDFQASLVKDMAGRALERYAKSGTNDCFRAIAEYSTQWATVEEEDAFERIVREISDYAIMLDQTLDDYHDSRWSDFGFHHIYAKFVLEHPKLPRFRIRTDVTGQSGKTPGRTGVYVSQDDPNASLQFAWMGNGGGKLRPSKTFSDIGIEALKKIGRDNLWIDEEKMFEFATKSQWVKLFEPTVYMLGKEHRDFAALAIADEAFVDRPCNWYFVEIMEGEFDDAMPDEAKAEITLLKQVIGGEMCRTSGFYFTPAHANSRRRLTQGERAPNFDSAYGKTIWQWDPTQS